METLKTLAFILICILAFVWGVLGAINETSDSKRKSRITYIGGSLIPIAVTVLIYIIYFLN